jgi:hypothetical protein
VCGRDFRGAGKNRYFCLNRHKATVHARGGATEVTRRGPVCVGDENYSSVSLEKTEPYATYLCDFMYLLHTKHENIVIPNVNKNECLIYLDKNVKRTTVEDAVMRCIGSFKERGASFFCDERFEINKMDFVKIVLSEGFYRGFVNRLKNTHDRNDRRAIVNNLRLLS